MKKERVCKSDQKINHHIKILILKYDNAEGSTNRTHRKLQNGPQFVTTRQDVLNFLNDNEKTGSIVDQKNSNL
jgi:hypothetical protein